ncbi:MAG: ABC transporter permease [Acidobacteriota bacterium]
MIHHMLKIVWNRKSSNALIILEVFVSFLVVFAVTAALIFSWSTYQRPLGYEWEDVWHVLFRLGDTENLDKEATAEANETVKRLVREIETLDPVVRAAAGHYPPYLRDDWSWSWTTSDEREIRTEIIRATPEFAEALQIETVGGRWFEASDAAMHWKPVVINRRLARDLFGDEDPIGQRVDKGEPDEDDDELRVVGLIEDYRKGGELAAPRNILFQPAWMDGSGPPLTHLAIRLTPGTSAAFEETLTERMQEVAPEWSFSVRQLATKREQYLRLTLAPLFAAGVVAGFLILMVALGLVGVLWQNVTQRTLEVGLRRAKGATRPHIHWQILGEMMTIATLGMALGILVVVQVPVLGWFSFLDLSTYVRAFVVSIATIYLLSAVCGLYPSWLAARIQPAEALHYE